MLKESMQHSLLSNSLLGTKGRHGLKAVLKESTGHPLLSISPLGTNGRDGQAGLKAVLKESLGHTLLSISPLQTKLMGWTSKTGSINGVHRKYFTFY